MSDSSGWKQNVIKKKSASPTISKNMLKKVKASLSKTLEDENLGRNHLVTNTSFELERLDSVSEHKSNTEDQRSRSLGD